MTTPAGRKFQSIDPSVPQSISPSVHQSFNPSVPQSFSPSVLQSFDCVVITTNHSVFDAEMIKDHANLIVDLRNVIKESADNLFKL